MFASKLLTIAYHSLQLAAVQEDHLAFRNVRQGPLPEGNGRKALACGISGSPLNTMVSDGKLHSFGNHLSKLTPPKQRCKRIANRNIENHQFGVVKRSKP